ncbi:ring-oxidation complex protein 1 in the phenylacetic acid catabolism pathway [Roseivivax halodurans JCM 10272]|uniref:Ring-oxidation complex protein 1 in the phenylacetic acid catabolism pathway n=2 Tax=Roseivivax halodurans TaxID=93683 RepID=X7EKG0_9RHOB|nr:ring-oxidation complex protein 1 in the phenylacetic acid catabolism pathway [Roseivivax halodurans JCM 10272]
MPVAEYLRQGGRLTSPQGIPPRYRAELMRLMSSFVDSELAGSAGFAAAINWAPGIKERIAASRITLEKADHAERVLKLMAEFGTDMARYEQAHDWSARVSRSAEIAASRRGGDMRLSVFHYPLAGWTDAVAMNVVMGLATGVQLAEMARASYQPLAEELRAIASRERRHVELGLEGLERIAGSETGRVEARKALTYWWPRVAETFGPAGSERFERLREMGLRHETNEALRARWEDEAKAALTPLGLG